MRVLLVEDETRLSATLSAGLEAEGFVVVAVGTGTDGLREATANRFDVIVLDIMLPGLRVTRCCVACGPRESGRLCSC